MPNAAPQELTSSESPSCTQRFASGASWSLVGTVGTRLFTFASNVIVARLLGQVGFGELAMILSTLGLLGTFSELGISGTATKYVAELRLKDPVRAGRIIGLTYLVSWTGGGLLALSCFLAAPWLAAKTLNAPHLAPEIRLASLLLFISAGFGPQVNILSGFQAFRAIAKVNWWQGLSNLPIAVLLVWLFGLQGAILALIFNALLGAVISACFLRREYKASQVRRNFTGAWRERPILWGYSLPAFLSSLILAPTAWAVNLILAHQPDGYAQLGLFNAAMQFNWLITAVNTIVSVVSVPILAEIHGQADTERFTRVFNQNLRLNWSLAILLAFVVLLLSPWLMLVFGDKFRSAIPLLPLVICSAVMSLVTAVNGQAFYSSGYMWKSFQIHLYACSLLLLASLLLIPPLKAKGMVIANLIAMFSALFFQFYFLFKIFNKKIICNTLYLVSSSLILVVVGSLSGGHHVLSKYNIISWSLGIVCVLFILKYNSSLFYNTYIQIQQLIVSKIGFLHAARKG